MTSSGFSAISSQGAAKVGGPVLAGTLRMGETARLTLAKGRKVYLVPVTGVVTVNGVTAHARDGVAIGDETEITIIAQEPAELVAVDVAG